MSLTQEHKKKAFEALWLKYPNKDGKKQAWIHYNNTVKTDQDHRNIIIALVNYISHLKQADWKTPKNGSTWFNNWHDWIKPFTPNELVNTPQAVPLTAVRIKDIKMRFSQAYQRRLLLRLSHLWDQSQKSIRDYQALNNAPCDMAKYKCPNCNQIITRSLRTRFDRSFLTKRGYKSYCGAKEPHRNVFMIAV